LTKIIIVRHGETEWNRDEIFRGRIDIGLNETGIRQAELLARYLRTREIKAIYSSPLQRARHTAEIIAQYQPVTIEVTPGLIDLNYGEWQGWPHSEVIEKYPVVYRQWLNNPHQVTIPGGENLDAVRQRAMAVINGVVAQHQGAIVLTSHRVVNKVLILILLGLDNSHFWQVVQDTGGITTFVYAQRRFTLTEHNNTGYLESLHRAPPADF